MKKIFFAIPSKSGQLEWPTFVALMRSHAACREQGWTTKLAAVLQESLIPNARNVLVAQFMETDCTDMFWVDDDQGWTPEGFVKLLNYEEPFVCAPYRHKSDVETYSFELAPPWPVSSGLLSVKYAGLGIAKISRTVIEQMIEAYPQTYRPSKYPKSVWPLFEIKWENGEMNGEDVCFCQKWRAIGGVVWVDPDQVTEHVGKKSYIGHYSEFKKVPPAGLEGG
jgi:hypothetical protein